MRTEVEQQANEEVEMLAHKYASEIRLMDCPTDRDEADHFVNILLNELVKRFQVPHYSYWVENARKRIWNIVYGAKEETKTDDWNGRC